MSLFRRCRIKLVSISEIMPMMGFDLGDKGPGGRISEIIDTNNDPDRHLSVR